MICVSKGEALTTRFTPLDFQVRQGDWLGALVDGACRWLATARISCPPMLLAFVDVKRAPAALLKIFVVLLDVVILLHGLLGTELRKRSNM